MASSTPKLWNEIRCSHCVLKSKAFFSGNVRPTLDVVVSNGDLSFDVTTVLESSLTKCMVNLKCSVIHVKFQINVAKKKELHPAVW